MVFKIHKRADVFESWISAHRLRAETPGFLRIEFILFSKNNILGDENTHVKLEKNYFNQINSIKSNSHLTAHKVRLQCHVINLFCYM